MSESTSLQPGQIVGGGRFTLTRALGRGGMGVVWLGQDTRLGEQVALKFLPPEVAADAVALNDLRRETARSHKLTHSNIIRIHDFHEQSDGVAFISMEFVDGPTLSAWRLGQAGQVLTWEQLSPLVQQLCAALDYAHGESVIHRDLKPANVMLDVKRRLKLADFGIAAVVSDSASRVSMLGTSGTLAYMSPQQLTGKRPTVTDDIYALGATLYELLTSKPPFYTGDLTHQVLHEPPEPLEERLDALGIQNEIPPGVAALIMACLAKDPVQRPQNARSVAEWVGLGVGSKLSLESLSEEVFSQTRPAEEPIVAREAKGARPIPSGPNRKRLWAGGAFAALLLLAFGGSYWVKHRATSAAHLKRGQPGSAATSMPEVPKDVAGSATPLGGSPTSLTAAASEEGFVSLFNGRDLSGWDGDPRFWLVREGCIVGETTWPKNILDRNTYLVWKGGEPGDFELRARCRMLNGNSGIQFRSRLLDRWRVVWNNGYQAEIDALGTPFWDATFGSLVAPLQVNCGEKAVSGDNGKKHLTGDTGFTVSQVRAAFAPEGWNEYVIIAQGAHVILKLNGLVTVDFTDDRPIRARSGVLALELYSNRGDPMRVQFKDIRLKRLNDGPASASMKGAGGTSSSSSSLPDLEPGQRWTNGVGMIFGPVIGTEVLFSIWETRVAEFAAFVKSTGYDATQGMVSLKSDGWKSRGDNWRNPGFAQTPTHPVCGVNWDDAQAFCAWLTGEERRAGLLTEAQRYRLPTDAEWSLAVGRAQYPWGNQWPPPLGIGNYAGEEVLAVNWPSRMNNLAGYRDDFIRTSPVGSFQANQFGLYDLGGNVWEWCEDYYTKLLNSHGTARPTLGNGDDGGGKLFRVLRGASWKNGSSLPEMQSDAAGHEKPITRRDNNGFRCVLERKPSP